jgi:hypothetical protein
MFGGGWGSKPLPKQKEKDCGPISAERALPNRSIARLQPEIKKKRETDSMKSSKWPKTY